MEIHHARYISSSIDITGCPSADKPEYAMIGRSNVGKSSLINMLTGMRKLAKVSEIPGKTQAINHFIINEQWYLADLPGYGYAKASKYKRRAFAEIIEKYILQRENLICLFVLIDSRHRPQDIDLAFMRWLGEQGVAFAMVFTKTDKLKEQELKKNIAHYNDQLLQKWESLPEQFTTSAVNGRGRKELLSYVEKLNEEKLMR